MNLNDLPTVEVAIKRREQIRALFAKYSEPSFWALFSQEDFDPDFAARIKLECAKELWRMNEALTAQIAELGVKEDA